jgi:hypothetical protein
MFKIHSSNPSITVGLLTTADRSGADAKPDSAEHYDAERETLGGLYKGRELISGIETAGTFRGVRRKMLDHKTHLLRRNGEMLAEISRAHKCRSGLFSRPIPH